MNAPCLSMAQVKAINTRKVNKVDGHTIFNMVKNMTGVPDEEILTVITPAMVPMIGRNDATQHYYRSTPQAQTWDSGQQVSWGNALKSLKQWGRAAQTWKNVEDRASLLTNPNTPPVVLTVRGTAFPPLTQAETDKLGHERMTQLLTQTHKWNAQKKAKRRYAKMSYKQVKKEFLTVPGSNYPLYNKNKKQREAMITQTITQNEDRRRATFYQDLWVKSGGAAEPSVLMMMGQQYPIYYMAWIIAKTYHMNNPEVKNVAGYEGRYKYRNWELKERYYPTIGKGDTLPKTTANWPRYSAAPPILNDFTMQEVAQALKFNFGHVLQAKKDADKGEIQKAVDAMKQRRDSLLQNPTHTFQQILSQGLNQWNQSMLANHAAYYAGQTRKSLPANKMTFVTYADLKKKMGAKKYNKTIKEYESKQKGIRDTTIKGAKANYDKALSNVGAAKGSPKTPVAKTGSS